MRTWRSISSTLTSTCSQSHVNLVLWVRITFALHKKLILVGSRLDVLPENFPSMKATKFHLYVLVNSILCYTQELTLIATFKLFCYKLKHFYKIVSFNSAKTSLWGCALLPLVCCSYRSLIQEGLTCSIRPTLDGKASASLYAPRSLDTSWL